VFLQGDWPGPPRDETTDDLFRFAARISTITNTPAIYLARVGRDGSSGTHALRHRKVELMITNAALDAIRERYRFEGFHVYGHSGGATLTGGLLALRTDIACAVPADGPLDTPVRRDADPALEIYSVAAEIPAIARNNAARILVVTDPQDLVVRIGWQLPFVEKLRRAGGKVEIFYVDSGGDEHAEHHFTTPHADLVMRDCIRGAGYEEIAADLAEFVARRLRTALERTKAQAAAAGPAPQSAPALADDAVTCEKASGGDSIAACARLLAQNPKDADVYYSRGYAYEWRKGDHDRAIADFSQAIAFNPKYALAYQDRGFSHEHKGDWDQALADFNQAILFDSNLFGAYNGRGNVYWHRGEIDRAIADYSQAILVNPKFAFAYRNRGLAYSAKGEHDRAIGDYDEALRLNPDFAEARENRERAQAALAERRDRPGDGPPR
jgi:tetratricopeptide (TPR) repeat protein